MTTKDTFEKMAKNTWLAGLGTINSSKELIEKSIGSAQEKSNALYNDLLTRGEEVQGKIEEVQGRIKERSDEMSAKGLKMFGISRREKYDDKIAELNAKVDTLSALVEGLVEQRKSEKPVAKTTAKKTTTTRRKAAPKADSTTKAVVKPKTTRTRKAATPKTAVEPKNTIASKVESKKPE